MTGQPMGNVERQPESLAEAFNECFQMAYKIANTPADRYENDTAWAHAMHSDAYKAYPKFQQVRAMLCVAVASAGLTPADGDGRAIIEAALAKATKADPSDAPFPLDPAQAAIWHQASASAYQHALEMIAPGISALATPAPDPTEDDLPALRELAQRAGIFVFEAQEEEIRVRWDWRDENANASDTSLGSEREAVMDALDSRFGTSWRYDVGNGNTQRGLIDYVDAELEAAEATLKAEAETDGGMRP